MDITTDDSGFFAGTNSNICGECLLMNDLRGDHEKTNGEASNYNRGACAVSLFERRNDKKLPTEKIRRKDRLIRINVSGAVYITKESTLAYFPETLLGSSKREEYFNSELGMYYFNRNRSMFDAILYFYQSKGVFKAPSNIAEEVVTDELAFFEISLDKIFEAVAEDSKIIYVPTTIKQKIREFVNNPHYSRGACAWAVIDTVFICVALILLVLETIPEIGVYFTDDTEPLYLLFFLLDNTVIAFFTVDLLLRLISWKNMVKFLTLPMHIMDILSILPFYIGLAADLLSNSSGSSKQHGYVALRVCRTFRIIRIFKFIRHSKELIVTVKVISSAAKELLVLLLLIIIFVLSCGTIMYYIENNASAETVFRSILEGCWWAVVTITTVGYGDMAPKTHLGRMFGSLVVIMGIVIIALPMTIIVSKFSSSYDGEKRQMEQRLREKLRSAREQEAIYIWEDASLNPNEQTVT